MSDQPEPFRPAIGWRKGILVCFVGAASLGAFVSLLAIPIAGIMFLFDDTGVPLNELGRQALVQAIPIPMFAVTALAGCFTLWRFSPRRMLAAFGMLLVTLSVLGLVPDTRGSFLFLWSLIRQAA
jgi:hypothetical protein